jgi:hypothetical protein
MRAVTTGRSVVAKPHWDRFGLPEKLLAIITAFLVEPRTLMAETFAARSWPTVLRIDVVTKRASLLFPLSA